MGDLTTKEKCQVQLITNKQKNHRAKRCDNLCVTYDDMSRKPKVTSELQHTLKYRSAPGENAAYNRLCVTCLIRGPTLAAHTAILLLGRQGFQDNVGGSEARQRDVTQVGERVFFRKKLAGFPPLAQESTFRK